MSINYNDLVVKSYFTEKNISGKFSPSTLEQNMIPCSDLSQFHYQTSFFLNFYASLYIELKKYEIEIQYNIIKFTDTINNLKINFNNTSYNTSVGATNKLSTFDSSSKIFTFYFKTFEYYDGETAAKNQSNLYTSPIYSSLYTNDILKTRPIFTDDILNKSSYSDALLSGITYNTTILDKNNIDSLIQYQKLKEILKEIFQQKPENIFGFLLYKQVFCNVILCNINIQNSLRVKYLNNTNLYLSDSIISFEANLNFMDVKTKINTNIDNIQKIKANIINNDFLIEKNKYKNKINSLNNLRDEFAKTQDKLNLSIKLYNRELTNYKNIKNYATYIIIILIIIMIFTIFLTIYPFLKTKTKNVVYIVIFIILSILTYIYYTSFKYTLLYENFDNLISNCSIISFTKENYNNITNHINYFNLILPLINNYSNSISDLFNMLRINIYTIGSKTFSQDANIYLYNLYLDKKRLLENNNIKLNNLFNNTEIIKKQTNYLFNFIFIISCLCLILLLGLILYSYFPHIFIFIIILCVVLITILMIYFAFAIIQPTRMIANKNYWAIANPSNKTMGKL